MNRRLQQIVYEWPPNLTQYEAAVFMGLSTSEAVGGGMAFMACLMLIPHKVVGGILGAIRVGGARSEKGRAAGQCLVSGFPLEALAGQPPAAPSLFDGDHWSARCDNPPRR